MMNDKDPSVKAAPRESVKLKKPHTHAGKHYDQAAVKKGVKINVTAGQKDFLSSQDII